jgi:hypothetical protein
MGTFWLADRIAEVARVRTIPVAANPMRVIIRLFCKAMFKPLDISNRTIQELINIATHKYDTNTRPKKKKWQLNSQHKQTCQNPPRRISRKTAQIN